jgi:hypothetical protein
MKKIVGILGAILLLNLTGCATEDYVRTQVDPLTERVNKLEAAVNAGSMTDADRVAIKQANDKSQQAIDKANALEGDVKQSAQKADEAATRAENAAKEAEQAANNAQQSVKKSEKIFKLEQKK